MRKCNLVSRRCQITLDPQSLGRKTEKERNQGEKEGDGRKGYNREVGVDAFFDYSGKLGERDSTYPKYRPKGVET